MARTAPDQVRSEDMFSTALWGYSMDQVDAYVEDTSRRMRRLAAEIQRLSVAENQLGAARIEISKLTSELAEARPLASVGPRVQAIIRMAEKEAETLRRTAFDVLRKAYEEARAIRQQVEDEAYAAKRDYQVALAHRRKQDDAERSAARVAAGRAAAATSATRTKPPTKLAPPPVHGVQPAPAPEPVAVATAPISVGDSARASAERKTTAAPDLRMGTTPGTAEPQPADNPKRIDGVAVKPVPSEPTKPVDRPAAKPARSETTEQVDHAPEPAQPEATKPVDRTVTKPARPEMTRPVDRTVAKPARPELTEPGDRTAAKSARPEVTQPVDGVAVKSTSPEGSKAVAAGGKAVPAKAADAAAAEPASAARVTMPAGEKVKAAEPKTTLRDGDPTPKAEPETGEPATSAGDGDQARDAQAGPGRADMRGDGPVDEEVAVPEEHFHGGSNKRRKRGRNQRVNGTDPDTAAPNGAKSYTARRS
ncbi:hypothetical protein [Catellatospora sp. NPDC049609]|uniref:hypothetical protein n=1 Tax=Catellatospora sp. NPDC049609 TaxID=3155505 RepID=UPI00342B365B